MKRSLRNLLVVVVFLAVLSLVLSFALKRIGEKTDILKVIKKEKIGVLNLDGPILDSRQILEDLREMLKDNEIKAIVLRVDSPGGGVGPSQEIYREIMRGKEKKPIVVSMGGLAASGGYYVACAGSKVLANPGTITGSIGVIAQFVNFQGLMEKVGINLEVVKEGEFKDVGSPHRRLNEREKEMLSKVMEDIHQQFVMDVAKARGIEVGRIKEIADGRIFSGREAKELGLVDELGNFEDAVEEAKALGGVKAEAEFVYPKKKSRFWATFMDEASKVILEKFLRLYLNEGLLREGFYPFLGTIGPQ